MTEPHYPKTLTVRCDGAVYAFAPDRDTVVIGRGDQADVHVGDPRISRAHVRLEPRRGRWFAVDNGSLNGIYVNGERRDSVEIYDGLRLYVGSPDGTYIDFAFDEDIEITEVVRTRGGLDDTTETDIDPGVLRAGAAAASRRRELEITQRNLAKYKIINAGALIAFEKGRSWPRERTRAKLEEVLQWPAGTIEQIRNGGAVPGTESAHPSDEGQASLIVDAAEVAMKTFAAAVDALPSSDSPEFSERISVIVADLRELEDVVARAARRTQGAPALALTLSAVRRRYDELMKRAAAAPGATLGQRLYAARRRADLSVAETANAAGLPPELIAAVEAEQSVSETDASRINALIDQLG
ncbi:FHA domain-containing protein [Mycobacterium sp. pUA109]|uniref:FHA domain-containing protein n=1 Tax=Mycobacterium sp. pUA109 TaxID=3238982 RepID=UPI00351B4A41